MLPPKVSEAPIALTVTVGPAGRSSSAAVEVLMAIEIVPPLRTMPGTVNSGFVTVSRPATPVLPKTSTPVASGMSTNVPSLSSEVVGSVLATVTLTVSPVASSVKSAVSVVPAIVSVVPVPVTCTEPGAKVAVSVPPNATPGSVVVTVPEKLPVTAVPIFRFAAPFAIADQAAAELQRRVGDVELDVRAVAREGDVAAELLAGDVERSARDREADEAGGGVELGADGAGERDARDGQRERAGEGARDLAGRERQVAGCRW